MCPKLHWDVKFQVMNAKMIDSIGKLKNTEIKPYSMCMHFSSYLIKKVFSGV